MVWLCRSPRRSPTEIRSGSVPDGGGLELSAVLAQLRLDVVEAEQRVHLGLGRAAVGGAGRVVEHPVLGDVQATADGRVTQGHVVLLGSREVLEQVAELVGCDDSQVDSQPGMRAQTSARLSGPGRGLDQLEGRGGADQGRGVSRRGDHVEVLDAVGPAPGRARQLDPLGRRIGLERRHQRLAHRERPVEHDRAGRVRLPRRR